MTIEKIVNGETATIVVAGRLDTQTAPELEKEFDSIACQIKDLTFDIKKEEIVSLLGPSGCGKSTILNIISSLEKESNGELFINCEIGYMFQKDNLLPWLNVYKNILIGLEVKRIKNKQNIDYALSLINKYGLNEFLHHYPNELSGGMRQRVSLIRTLTTKPDLLLLDEPFSALDAQTKLMVQNDVYTIIKQEKKSALIVTHDISEAIALSDKIIILSNRPASIKKMIDININNLSPLDRRKNILFSSYYNEICEELGIK